MKAWIEALRPRTLPLAVSSIGMGSFLAEAYGRFDWLIFILAVITTTFLQMLSNLANDYGDFKHGADSLNRKGPARMTYSGKISVEAMRKAINIFAGLSLISGSLLLIVAFQGNWNAIFSFFALGVICIIAAMAYTMGVKPYGYKGLGDISVLLFFGIVGVGGSFYLYTHQWDTTILLPAISCGLFSVGVLNINNIRDIDSDLEAGKISIPVRIGKQNATFYHWLLLSGGIFCAVVFTILHYQSEWQWLFLAAIPLFIYNGIKVYKLPSERLDPYLRQMAISTLVFVITFGIGVILAF